MARKKKIPKHGLIDENSVLAKDRFVYFHNGNFFARLKKRLERKVKQWRWATDEMLSPTPFYSERYPGGRWKKGGKPTGKDWGHGLDADGKLIILVEPRALGGKWESPYVFYDYRKGFMEAVHFNHARNIVWIKHFYYEPSGQLSRMVWFRGSGGTEEMYTWETDQLVSYSGFSWESKSALHLDESWTDKVNTGFFYHYVIRYGLDSQVTEIIRDEGASQEVEYRRKRKGESVTTVGKEIESFLDVAIPRRLAEVTPASPVYCVFITYCCDNLDLPPALLLATEEELAAVGEENRWCIGELGKLWVGFENRTLNEQWAFFYQLMSEKRNYKPAIQLLRRVAKRMNGQGIGKKILATKNVVVTPADSSLQISIRDDLQQSTSPSLRKTLDLSSLV